MISSCARAAWDMEWARADEIRIQACGRKHASTFELYAHGFLSLHRGRLLRMHQLNEMQ